MKSKDDLFLHEEILLLALKDNSGTLASGTHYQYALAGAVLAELLLNQRLSVEEQKKKKYARIESSTLLGDPVIDECLNKVVTAKKRQQLQTWVSRFSGVKDLKNRVAQQLVNRGILRIEEDKVLLLFKRKLYPEFNPEPERKLIKRLHEALFSEESDIDPRTVVLLSLANSAYLLKVIFDKKELKARKQRIEKIVNGELSGKATKEAIEAMQAAIMVAVIIPSIVAASTASH
jgi:Golgi phosphoprotein 3